MVIERNQYIAEADGKFFMLNLLIKKEYNKDQNPYLQKGIDYLFLFFGNGHMLILRL